MTIPLVSRSLLSIWLLFVAFAANAEEPLNLKAPLSLAETIQLATQNQPLLQSLDDAAASVRQSAIAEGQLPDPKLKFGLINLPVTGSDALRYSRDDQTMVNIGYSQEVIHSKNVN